VFACELVTVNTTEGAALGAALLAGTGCGHWPDVESACAAAVRVSGCVSPRAEGAPYTSKGIRNIRRSIPRSATPSTVSPDPRDFVRLIPGGSRVTFTQFYKGGCRYGETRSPSR
jgi:hypothetical protein